ncbi:unnamed protein product [Lathyrus oleraceus]|uniref:Protein yippee-like n=1 Tax=Pisum sativum TaxID=3888 RepID=A0A9D4XSZ1_PEA|nr:hypothetical protein KIW84_032315 [Pisum sativum]
MGRLFLIDLEENFYSCKNCETPVALANHLLSRDYQCPYGRAYLFDKVVNVLDGEIEEPIPESNSTMIHLFCVQCQSIVGFKFVLAYDEFRRYREGKFILARLKILVPGEYSNMPALEDV